KKRQGLSRPGGMTVGGPLSLGGDSAMAEKGWRMTADIANVRSIQSGVTVRAIEPAQRTAAKVAGLFYLLMLVTATFAGLYGTRLLIVSGYAVETAKRIAASEGLFRLGIASDVVTFAGDIVLIWALYVVLRPVNRNAALLAAFWRVAECAILAIATLSHS